MSGKVLLDTNIIVYLLKGDVRVVNFLKGKEIYISFITELELLSYNKITKDEELIIENLLSEFKIIELNTQIKKEVIRLRKKYGLKLPDSIVISTASYLNIHVITADKKLLKAGDDIATILVEI